MGAVMSVEPEYEWPRPPEGGYVAEDLDRLPNLPPHTELIDGSLVFVSPQAKFHMRAIGVLERNLLRCAPPELEIVRELTVQIGRRNRPEPDIMVTRAEADTGPGQTTYRPEDVVLVVEIVAPESMSRDRETKPLKYAKAGIQHFWRVENDNGHAVVYVFELEPATRTYAPVGTYRDQVKVSAPFPIDIDLNEVRYPRR